MVILFDILLVKKEKTGEIQMKCVNCGASYPDIKEQCPYCGSENTKQAEQAHKDRLAWYEYKSSFLRRLPEVIGRLAGKLVVRLLMIVIIGGILLALVSAGLAKLKSTIVYENKDSVMDSLEAMYQAEDYGAMMELLKQQEYYTSATYGRYYRIGELYEYYQPAAEVIDEDLQRAEKYEDPDYLYYTIKPLFRILSYCDEYEAEGYVYDEGTEVEAFRQKAENILKEKCYLSEEEVERGLQLYRNEEDMMEIYQLILEKYEGRE